MTSEFQMTRHTQNNCHQNDCEIHNSEIVTQLHVAWRNHATRVSYHNLYMVIHTSAKKNDLSVHSMKTLIGLTFSGNSVVADNHHLSRIALCFNFNFSITTLLKCYSILKIPN